MALLTPDADLLEVALARRTEDDCGAALGVAVQLEAPVPGVVHGKGWTVTQVLVALPGTLLLEAQRNIVGTLVTVLMLSKPQQQQQLTCST